MLPHKFMRQLHPLLRFHMLTTQDGKLGRSGGCCSDSGTWLIPLAWFTLFFPNCLAACLRSQPQPTLLKFSSLHMLPKVAPSEGSLIKKHIQSNLHSVYDKVLSDWKWHNKP